MINVSSVLLYSQSFSARSGRTSDVSIATTHPPRTPTEVSMRRCPWASGGASDMGGLWVETSFGLDGAAKAPGLLASLFRGPLTWVKNSIGLEGGLRAHKCFIKNLNTGGSEGPQLKSLSVVKIVGRALA